MEGKSVIISYETLFEFLRIERSRTQLQKLSKTYSEDIKTLIETNTTQLSPLEGDEKRKKEIYIKNTLKIIKELYERRERKIVQLALDKSKTKSALIDFNTFLPNEKELFDSILSILNKQRDEYSDALRESSKLEASQVSADLQKAQPETEEKKPEKEDSVQNTFRTVRFLSPIPRFLGPQLEEYGPFDEEDIANLPSKIVDLLVKKKRAEEIVIK